MPPQTANFGRDYLQARLAGEFMLARHIGIVVESADANTISRYQAGSTCAGPQRPSAAVCDAWIGPPARSPVSADTRYTSTDAPDTAAIETLATG